MPFKSVQRQHSRTIPELLTTILPNTWDWLQRKHRTEVLTRGAQQTCRIGKYRKFLSSYWAKTIQTRMDIKENIMLETEKTKQQKAMWHAKKTTPQKLNAQVMLTSVGGENKQTNHTNAKTTTSKMHLHLECCICGSGSQQRQKVRRWKMGELYSSG